MSIFNEIISLGPSVMMPIIFFILALVFRVKIGNAFKSAMLVGVGFVGIDLIVTTLLNSLGPATQDMVQRFGLKFTVVDAGWPTGASIGWASPLVPLVVAGAIIVNILMLLLKQTKTVNIDIFNYWLLLLPGGMIYYVTNNIVIAFIACMILYIIAFIIADKTAPKIHEMYKMKGVSFVHATCGVFVPVGILVNAIIERIPGLNKINLNPDSITKKLGVLGEPLALATFLGAGLGILAGWDAGHVMKLAVTVAAVMLLLPKMVGVVVEGVTIVREAAETTLQKKFPGREFYIGMDTALLIAEPSILATGFLLIPAALILAVILPGNRMLPFADLASIVFIISMVAPFCKKNMFRIFCTGLVILTITLYGGTALSEIYTAVAGEANISLPENVKSQELGNLVSSYNTPLGWGLIELAKLFGK